LRSSWPHFTGVAQGLADHAVDLNHRGGRERTSRLRIGAEGHSLEQVGVEAVEVVRVQFL
jgi:hypothetical protein